MNRMTWALGMLALFLSFGTAFAGTDPSSAGPATTAAVNSALAGNDRSRLEGWINGIDYRNNSFRLLDGRGFQTRVTTKQGVIGDFRMGDKVRVEVNQDYNRAEVIEKLYA